MLLKVGFSIIVLASVFTVQVNAVEKRKPSSSPQEEQAAFKLLEKYEPLFGQIKGIVAQDVGNCKILNTGKHTTDEVKPSVCVRISLNDKSVLGALKATFGNQWLNLERTRVEFLLSSGSSPE